MRKRVYIMAITLITAVSCAGCGNASSGGNAEISIESETQQKEEDTLTVSDPVIDKMDTGEDLKEKFYSQLEEQITPILEQKYNYNSEQIAQLYETSTIELYTMYSAGRC